MLTIMMKFATKEEQEEHIVDTSLSSTTPFSFFVCDDKIMKERMNCPCARVLRVTEKSAKTKVA